MQFLSDGVRIDRPMTGQAAGTTNVTGNAIDLGVDVGYDEVTFLLLLGTLTATQVTQLEIQESPDNSTWTTVPNTTSPTAVTSGDMLAITIRPSQRYVRPVVLRGTANAVIDGVVAILSKPHALPTAQPAVLENWANYDFLP